MKPAYAIYMLEIEWTWDHFNHEYATYTIEGCEGARVRPDLEELLKTPDGRSWLKSQLQPLADAMDKSVMGKAEMIRFFRVVDDESKNLRLGVDQHGPEIEMHLKLKLLCTFDREGNPVPVGIEEELRA